MFLKEQIEALKEAKKYFEGMLFKAPVRSKKKLEKGTENKFGKKPWQNGHLMLINAHIQMREFVETVFNVPHLKLYLTTQDELERLFSILRGLGDYSLHPSALQYHQRLLKHIMNKMLEAGFSDLNCIKQHLYSVRGVQDNVQFSINIEDLPEANFGPLEIQRIQDVASKIIAGFPDIGSGFLEILKQMYHIFNSVHPKDGLQPKNNLLTGE